MTSFAFVSLGVMVFFAAGCGSGPAPRMMSLVGQEAFDNRSPTFQDREWTRLSRIGLVVHSDDTGSGAAPAITESYLETLTRRTEEFLKQQCAFQDILTVSTFSHPVDFSSALESQFQNFPVSHQILVVFSGWERVGPEKIGEATVMTQMSGTVIEHYALAEIGVLRRSDRKMVYWVSGQGTESLEQLDAPIGKNQPSPSEARDILRARSGQQALDRALEQFAEACQRTRPGG
ncbi:MAG: hypothetical protein AB7P17_08980 [Nitrospirales bacterium]|nr:hypothetical protein [Nitrospirales bacterium]